MLWMPAAVKPKMRTKHFLFPKKKRQHIYSLLKSKSKAMALTFELTLHTHQSNFVPDLMKKHTGSQSSKHTCLGR